MSDIINITVEIPVKNESHGIEVAAAMGRVSEICSEIVRRDPQGWYGIGRAIADAEKAVQGCNFAEVEFASYLAGLSVPKED